jgi:hypothetical protein
MTQPLTLTVPTEGPLLLPCSAAASLLSDQACWLVTHADRSGPVHRSEQASRSLTAYAAAVIRGHTLSISLTCVSPSLGYEREEKRCAVLPTRRLHNYCVYVSGSVDAATTVAVTITDVLGKPYSEVLVSGRLRSTLSSLGTHSVQLGFPSPGTFLVHAGAAAADHWVVATPLKVRAII